jgi:hypothetical protein
MTDDFRKFIPALPYRDTPRMPDGIVRYGDAAMTEYALLAAKAAYAAAIEDAAKVCDAMVEGEYRTGKVDHNERGWTQACAAAIRAAEGDKQP